MKDKAVLKKAYEHRRRNKILLISGITIVLVIIAIACMTLGMKDISWLQPISALQHFASGDLNRSSDAAINKIILFLRMPRILLALIAGFGLAVAGALMQSLTRNYLVSPFTLGISSAAAFGASLCIVFGTGLFWQSNVGIVSSAFLMAMLCGALVYGISRKIGIIPFSLVLVGIALNYFFAALTATIEFFAQEHKLGAVIQWTFGTVNNAEWNQVLLCMIVVGLGFLLTKFYNLQLNAMASNDDETLLSLGVNPQHLRTVFGIISVLITATIISFTGIIGFVGLVAPHMARFIIGTDHTFYLPFSGILGAMLLVCADTVGKIILYPVIIPVGIVISFLGVPLFIHLILTRGRSL